VCICKHTHTHTHTHTHAGPAGLSDMVYLQHDRTSDASVIADMVCLQHDRTSAGLAPEPVILSGAGGQRPDVLAQVVYDA
jgi:hypothetical protein